MIRLAQLSAEERDFLCAPDAAEDAFAPFLIHHLRNILCARLRQPITVEHGAPRAAGDQFAADAPEISWEPALDDMWLCGRLGGPPSLAAPAASAMTANLERTLLGALAEVWRSLPTPRALPPALSLRVANATTHAHLLIRFPSSLPAMNRWAQNRIRHAQK